MKVFFAVVLLYYFFGVQYFLESMTGLSGSVIGWINIIVITAVSLLYYHCKTHESSRKQIVSVSKAVYSRLRSLTEKYLFVLALVLFVLATVAQVFRPIAGGYAGWFFAAWILTLCIGRDAFWDAKIYFARHLFLHKESIFWVSIGLTFLIIYWAQVYMPWSVLIALFVGFVVYATIIKKAHIVRGYSMRKLFPTRVYAVAIVVTAGCIAAIQYNMTTQDIYDYGKTVLSSYRDRTSQAWETITTPSIDDVDTIVSNEEVSDIVVVGMSEEVVSEQAPIQEEEITPVEQESVVQDPGAQVTFTQALTHLFDVYDIALSTATNTRFNNIPASDPRYALFKTAHEKRLLGANINPDGLVRCDVYLVMKGIVAGWAVGSQRDVFDQYRAAAQANNAINGCTRDGMVRVGNL